MGGLMLGARNSKVIGYTNKASISEPFNVTVKCNSPLQTVT